MAAATDAGSATVKTKISALRRLKDYGVDIFDRIKTDGWQKTSTDEWNKIYHFGASLPDRIRDSIETFRSMSTERAD
jgi:hypothetical protein